VGLLYLVPGSLGSTASPTWFFADFPAPDGVASALAFLNAAPQQGEGELSGYARSDGSAVIGIEPGQQLAELAHSLFWPQRRRYREGLTAAGRALRLPLTGQGQPARREPR
jgi:hypothetical protein